MPRATPPRTDLTLVEARESARGRRAEIVNFYRWREGGGIVAVAPRAELLEVAVITDEGDLVRAEGLWPESWAELEAISPSKVPAGEAARFTTALLGENYGSQPGDIEF